MNRLSFATGIVVRVAILAIGVGCADAREVRVQLEAHRAPSSDARQLDVQAQVMGPQAGLRYKWYSVLGEFDPQDSYAPRSSFTFASTSSRDRVRVEVWRENERVAETELDVGIDSTERAVHERPPAIQISIAEIPRYQPEGGPDTRANIGGKVTGEISPDYRVVIYARADAWYVQPTPYASHPIQPDDTWNSWTHTGSSYAALVVRKDFKPLARLDVLPHVEGDVLARAIVEGKKQ
jgi:hypothetical protein